MNFYGVGDTVDVRFKDLTGDITWVPGKITAIGSKTPGSTKTIGSKIEVYLEDNPFRFTKVYVDTERLRKHEEDGR